MPEVELLTVYEVAEELRLNPQTVRNYIDRGELKAIRVGGRRVRVARDDLTEFLGLREDQVPRPSNRRRIEELEQRVNELERRIDQYERLSE